MLFAIIYNWIWTIWCLSLCSIHGYIFPDYDYYKLLLFLTHWLCQHGTSIELFRLCQSLETNWLSNTHIRNKVLDGTMMLKLIASTYSASLGCLQSQIFEMWTVWCCIIVQTWSGYSRKVKNYNALRYHLTDLKLNF